MVICNKIVLLSLLRLFVIKFIELDFLKVSLLEYIELGVKGVEFCEVLICKKLKVCIWRDKYFDLSF